MGRISRLGPWAMGALALLFTLGSLGCGSSTRSGPSNVPITVSLSPSPIASMNLGATLQFTASVNQGTTVISTPIKFISDNARVLSFSPSGLACAGRWDTSFIVCNPGTSGVVGVLAAGFGTASALTTVYVHPQVTNIQISSLSTPPPACVSQNQTENFQATIFSGGTDITPFVGPLTWTAMEPAVAKTSTTVSGLGSNQVQVTAAQPGLTHLFANVSGINSQSAAFETCPVQSISVLASSTGTDSLSLQKGSSSTLTPTIIDSQGNTITVTGSGTTGLTWVSSQPGVATTKSGSVTTVNPGGAAIFPVCAPPGCNTNLYSVYPGNVVSTTVTGAAAAGTVYVTSTGCYAASCATSLIPINTQTRTPAAAIALPSAPNSMVVDPTGTNVYLGTAAGLRILATSTSAFTAISSVTGKVLAASLDGTKAIVSNTTGNPNVVYVVDVKASTSTPLLLSGVTVAVFSPDSTKAYLLAGNILYVYSTTSPLQTINLPGSSSDAAFLTTGTFGFVATPPSTISLFNGCDNAVPQSPNTPTVTTISPPALLAALPDGKTMAAVTSPGFTSIAVATTAAGCPPPVTAAPTFHDFGQGPFTPKQILVSSDGSRLYVISNLNTIMVYDFTTASVKTIPLSFGATPLSAALTLNGQNLYVGASDRTVHILDAASTFTDLGQIPVSLCSNTSANCLPDLVALRP